MVFGGLVVFCGLVVFGGLVVCGLAVFVGFWWSGGLWSDGFWWFPGFFPQSQLLDREMSKQKLYALAVPQVGFAYFTQCNLI